MCVWCGAVQVGKDHVLQDEDIVQLVSALCGWVPPCRQEVWSHHQRWRLPVCGAVASRECCRRI